MLGATVGAVLAAIGVLLLALRWTGTGDELDRTTPAGVPRGARLRPPHRAGDGRAALRQRPDAGRHLHARPLSLARRDAHAATDDARRTSSSTRRRAANEWVAVYRACQLFAFLPYQLLFSVTQVLFPMLARAKTGGRRRARRRARRAWLAHRRDRLRPHGHRHRRDAGVADSRSPTTARSPPLELRRYASSCSARPHSRCSASRRPSS